MNTERITQMEHRLDRATAAVEALETAMEQYQAAQDDLAALDAYLGSPEWHADRNDDEAGRLPADLRHGVLNIYSVDGKVLRSMTVNSNTSTSLAGLPHGTYIATFTGRTSFVSLKTTK